MRGSTLHRSGLTREKMGVLATFTQAVKKQSNPKGQLNQYYRAAKNQELDLLWDGVQKGVAKVHSATRSVHHKSPAVYLLIGFVAGVIFMSCITLIVSISAMAPRGAVTVDAKSSDNVAVIGEEKSAKAAEEPHVSQEKYVIKSGDTINGIAYRFYGRYNEAKIQEIIRINGITNPAGLKVGQELIIPVSQER